jgi:hypothetical protein
MRPAILGSFASTGLTGQGLGGLPPVAEGEKFVDVADSGELRRGGDGGVEAMALALQSLGPMPASAAGGQPSVTGAAQRGSSRGVHGNDGNAAIATAAPSPDSRAQVSSSLAAAAGAVAPASPTPLPAALLRAVPPASWEDEADAALGAAGSGSAAPAHPSSAGQLPRHSLRAAAAALLPRAGLGASGTPTRAAVARSADAAASAPSPLAGETGTPVAKTASNPGVLSSPGAPAAARFSSSGVAAIMAIQSPAPASKHADPGAAATGAGAGSSLTTLPSGRKPRLGIPKPGGTRQAVSDPSDALATLAAAARASGPSGALAALAVDGGADGSAERSVDDGARCAAGTGAGGSSNGRRGAGSAGPFAAARFGDSGADGNASARRPTAAHPRYDPLPAHAAAAIAAAAASSETETTQSPQAGLSVAGGSLGRAPALPDDPMLLLMMVPGMRELAAAVDRERQR